MADSFFGLAPDDRHHALQVAVSSSGKPAHLLEKDIWTRLCEDRDQLFANGLSQSSKRS